MRDRMSHTLAEFRTEWVVSRWKDRPWTIGTISGVCMAVRPAFVTDKDWAPCADRIVACVNACAGIPDPAALRSQRDALLEACKAAEWRYRSMWFGTEGEKPESNARGEWHQLRRAIAAAEVQA